MPLAIALGGVVVVLVALVALRGTGGVGAGQSTPPGTGGSGRIAASSLSLASTQPSLVSGNLPALPAGLDDRGWIVEIGVQRWLAGSLSGRSLLLPPDEIALAATGDSVVSVRYGSGGRTSTVRVRNLVGGRIRVSVDRTGTISSAVVAGTSVYVTGDDGTGGGADAGVQAISLSDGSVRDVIPPGPAPADATDPVTRSQLRLDPTGRTLGSPLCAGDTCTVDVIDLASGARTTPVRNAHGFLTALSSRTLYLVNDTATSLEAIDTATGQPRWRRDGIQLGGVLPTADGKRVLYSYLPLDGSHPLEFTLISADTADGSGQPLLVRRAETDVPTFYPSLSDDRFAVIGSGGRLADLLGGASRRAGLTLVDTRTGATQTDAVTITAP